jgi:hypothetical protein
VSTKKKDLTVVHIEWIDSCSNSGWRNPEEDGISHIHSVGLLVREQPEYVTLSSSKGEYGKYSDMMSIPRSCITRMKKLKVR